MFFMDSGFLTLVVGGAVIGMCIGMTGVGGGSLMTPWLNAIGTPLPTAIGTDLIYATLTKASSVFTHHRQGTIHWNITFRLAAGSLPAALLTALALRLLFPEADYSDIVRFSLGFMLLVTAAMLFFRERLQRLAKQGDPRLRFLRSPRHPLARTVIAGAVVGVLVTLSSVGAGVFGTVALLLLYPHLMPNEIVGTELAHAVPLTLVAGLGHWLLLGNIDWNLLTALLIGSVPGAILGARVAGYMPQKTLGIVLSVILAFLGLRLLLN